MVLFIIDITYYIQTVAVCPCIWYFTHGWHMAPWDWNEFHMASLSISLERLCGKLETVEHCTSTCQRSAFLGRFGEFLWRRDNPIIFLSHRTPEGVCITASPYFTTLDSYDRDKSPYVFRYDLKVLHCSTALFIFAEAHLEQLRRFLYQKQKKTDHFKALLWLAALYYVSFKNQPGLKHFSLHLSTNGRVWTSVCWDVQTYGITKTNQAVFAA